MSFAYRPGFGLGVGGDMGGADIRKGVTGFDYFTCTEPSWEVPGISEGYREIIHSSEYKEI